MQRSVRALLIATMLASFILIFAFAPVQAATIEVDSNSDVALAGDGICTLREAILNANGDSQLGGSDADDCEQGAGADVITFAGNYTITMGSAYETINNSLTITGNGTGNTIIQASTCDPVNLPGGCTPATHRVFSIEADVIFNDLTIRHGRCANACTLRSFDGGGIYFGGGTQLTLNNVQVLNNRSGDEGGGVYGDLGVSLIVDASTISNNMAGDNGGGIFNRGDTVNIQNGSLITENEVTASNSTGGGIYNDAGVVTIDASSVNGNRAHDGGGIGNSGTVNILSGSSVDDNVTFDAGGGIFQLDNTGAILNVTDSTVSGNIAGSGAGGIYNGGGGNTITIDNSAVSDNKAVSNGGGIFSYTGGIITIKNGSSIDGNESTGGSGGGLYSFLGTLTVEASTVSGNTIAGNSNGGGIYAEESDVDILNGSLVDNNRGAVNGGGIYLDNFTLTVDQSTISNNQASSNGGGIYLWNGVVDLTESTVAGNDAGSNGGGVYVAFGDTFSAVDSTISGNQALGGNGGGIYNFGIITLLENSTISGNNANGEGGGIANYDTITSINNSTFSGNSAGNLGSGIHNEDTITAISNTIIADSTGGNCSGTFPVGTNSLSDDGSCNFGAGNNNITPGLHYDATLANNGGFTETHALLLGSTAINTSGAGATTADQRGMPMLFGTRDIGAYEYGYLPLVATFKCNGTELMVSVASGNPNFSMALVPPGGGSAGGSNLPIPLDVPFDGGIYGTWANIEITDGYGLIYYYPDVTCRAPKDSSPAPVIASSDPAISKSGSPLNATVGETVVWTIQVWNPGSTATDTLFINDPIPDMFDITDVTTTHGSASINGQVVTIDIGTLQPGETATIQIFTVANDLAADGQVCNTAYIGLIEAVACVNIFPGELPPTGGEPVARLWLAVFGALAAIGLGGGAFALRRRTV